MSASFCLVTLVEDSQSLGIQQHDQYILAMNITVFLLLGSHVRSYMHVKNALFFLTENRP
jgi:hypothetical protein